MSKINKKSYNLYGDNNIPILQNTTVRKVIDKIKSSKIGDNYNIKITLKPKKEKSDKKQNTIEKFKNNVKLAKELQKKLPPEEQSGSYKKLMAYIMASEDKKKTYQFPSENYKKLFVVEEKKDGEIKIETKEKKPEELIIPKL